MKKPKTIGILTSGGDAPGMNAVVRSVVRSALHNDMLVRGILKGYNGLMNRLYFNDSYMKLRDVSGILEQGGTILYSARCLEFMEPEGVRKACQNCFDDEIEGLIVCGGDGSFKGARDLSELGVPCIGIPGTIDNDIAASDYTIGFDTAVNTVVQNIDRLRDTSESHDRCSVVEVMGNHCGDIALHSAICCGAVSVLIPEIPFDLEKDVIGKMRQTLRTGKNHFIIIVAEGVTKRPREQGGLGMSSQMLADFIEDRTGVESRATIIGHVQRGGCPTARDRVIGSRMGHYAVELLLSGIGKRVVAMRDDKIVDYDIKEALELKKRPKTGLFKVAEDISI